MEFFLEDTDARVRGLNINATIEAFRPMPSAGQWLVERHGIQQEQVSPDVWVPVQLWLNALRDLQERCGSEMLRQVGKAIIDNAHFPVAMPTVESVLHALDAIYYLNHRGQVGHYVCRSEKDVTIIDCETPYPKAFERGLIEGIVRKPALCQGKSYHIDYEPNDSPKATRTCTLRIKQVS